MSVWKGRSAWSIADNFAQQALSFAIFVVLARWLTPHEFGLLAIAHLMVQFVRMTVLDAMAMPVVRGQDSSDGVFNWLFTLCAVVSLTLASAMALLSPSLARFFGTPELTPVLLGMSAAIVLFGLVRAHEARLLREGNFRLLAIRSIVSVSAGGVVALILVLQGAGAMALVAQQLTTGIVALVIATVAEWRIWRPRWLWSADRMRAHFGEMGKVSASALLNYANTSGDAALVSVLLGPYATGVYNLAKRVLSAAYLVVGASLVRVGVTLFVQQQRDPAVLRESYARMLTLVLLMMAPVYSLVTALAEPMVVVVFGEQWRSSAPLFGWLSLAYMGQAAFVLGQNLSFTTGRSGRVAKLAFVQMLLAAALALLLVRGYGTVGIAAGLALGSLAGMTAMQWIVARQLRLSWRRYATAVLPAALGAVAATAAVAGFADAGMGVTGWASLAVVGTAGLLAYGLSAGLVQWRFQRLASAAPAHAAPDGDTAGRARRGAEA